MEPWLQAETDALRRSWDRHAAEDLRDYLVASVEDPRLNVASILTRHFLVELLFGERFAALQREELRFGLALNWLLQRLAHPIIDEDLLTLRAGLQRPRMEVDGAVVPLYLHQAFASLPLRVQGVEVPNYLDAVLQPALLASLPPRLPEDVLNTFARLWQPLLSNEPPERLSVLEPACGSANEYRYFPGFGLARCLDYRGFDLCGKNVENARALCPGVDFQIGNALAMSEADRSFDVVVVHDLFEHLSPAALEHGLSEVCRVARQALFLSFFQMHEGPEHWVRPVDDYHWNQLSLPRVRAAVEAAGFATQVMHLGTMIGHAFPDAETHNPDAYLLRAWRR